MDVPVEQLKISDIVIAVMGPTGAGKSNFIDVLNNQRGARSSNKLKSYTSEVQGSLLKGSEEEYNRRVILVDTPGFDDTTRSDLEILDMIAEWLRETYQGDIKLTGIVYMHRISDNRMGGTPLKNLHMFGELCGNTAMSRVILVTSMWDNLKGIDGARREQELKEKFWKPMLERGSQVARFGNDRESAKKIIDAFIREDQGEKLLLQEELVDLGRHLNETHAGRMLYSTLQRLLEEQKASIDKLMVQIGKEGNDGNRYILEKLEKERGEIIAKLQKTVDGVRQLKVPLTRRIILFFFGKKGKIKGMADPEAGLAEHPQNRVTAMQAPAR